MFAGADCFAFSLTGLLAVSAGYADTSLAHRIDMTVPRCVPYLFLVVLGCVSTLIGIMNPEAMALLGSQGIVGP